MTSVLLQLIAIFFLVRVLIPLFFLLFAALLLLLLRGTKPTRLFMTLIGKRWWMCIQDEVAITVIATGFPDGSQEVLTEEFGTEQGLHRSTGGKKDSLQQQQHRESVKDNNIQRGSGFLDRFRSSSSKTASNIPTTASSADNSSDQDVPDFLHLLRRKR